MRFAVILGTILVFLWFFWAIPCYAHWADLAVAEIRVQQSEVQITLTIPTGLLSSVRTGKNSTISMEEIKVRQKDYQAFFNQRLQVLDGRDHANLVGVELSSAIPANVNPQKSPHTTFSLMYNFLKVPNNLKIYYDLFLPGVPTASCLATVLEKDTIQTFVFTPRNQEFSLHQDSVMRQALSFVILGVEHILTGYDHILFLVSLLIIAGGMGYLLKVITSFTLAHSITLSLAVLNIVNVSNRWVEVTIALTIAYVAAENFWRKTLDGRWMITFCFGLIHGLGFASVLKALIPQSHVALSLASFNLGVEIGQFAIVAVVYWLVMAVKNYSWEPAARRLVSAAIVLVAVFWFIQRAFF